MAIRFGTDGVRGRANTDLTAEDALRLGRAVAEHFGPGRVLVGRDTRRSGPMLEAAFSAGAASGGASVGLLGVVPTPAVAAEAAADGCVAAVISASHNRFDDNGIKVFGIGGRKLDDDAQLAIEQLVSDSAAGHVDRAPTGADVGTIEVVEGAGRRHVDRVVSSVEGKLTGLDIVVDGANGAASWIGPKVFAELGASVRVIGGEPNGVNINEKCGSTHLDSLASAVVGSGAAFGVALDGDADRCLAVDHTGEVVDGDAIMAILALDMASRGTLDGGSVAVTVMSNLGFRRAMAAAGVRVVETAVGDRHVLDALDREQLVLGGEQSGHIIMRRFATTGDGVLAAAQLAAVVVREAIPLRDLARRSMTRFPQVMISVAVDGPPADAVARAADAVRDATNQLEDDGRVLVRASGTEPVVRVMVEAVEQADAERWAERLAAAVGENR